MDLKLTSDGDLSIKKSKFCSNKLKINFIVSKEDSLKINFFVPVSTRQNINENYIKINFITNNSYMNFYEGIVLNNIETTKQKIGMVIKSTLGKSDNLEYGSFINTYDGKQINNKNADIIRDLLYKDISRSLNIDDISIECTPMPSASTYIITIRIDDQTLKYDYKEEI